MPCAAGELCQLLDDTTPELSCCGPCQGRLHRICGEIHNPDDDQDENNRICQSCVAAKTADATSGRSNAAKRKEGGSFPQQGAPKKRKNDNRKRLTLCEKLEILKLLDQKVARGEIARRFKCGISTVGDIKKDRATLESSSSWSATSKSRKGGDFPKIDRYTMELVETARAAGLPVIRSTIQTFGVKARDAAVAKAQTDEVRAKYEGFTASIHWAKNFIVRNNLSKTRLRGLGDEGSVDATLGRQDPPREEGVRNATDEGGPGDGGHPAPEGEEEEEQKKAFDEEDPNNKPVADHAGGPTSRPNADTKKAEPGAGRGAKRGPVPPPYSDVADYFGRLEATAVECAMDRVSHFLRLAKMEWIDEFEKRKGRQTDIRDFLSSK